MRSKTPYRPTGISQGLWSDLPASFALIIGHKPRTAAMWPSYGRSVYNNAEEALVALFSPQLQRSRHDLQRRLRQRAQFARGRRRSALGPRRGRCGSPAAGLQGPPGCEACPHSDQRSCSRTAQPHSQPRRISVRALSPLKDLVHSRRQPHLAVLVESACLAECKARSAYDDRHPLLRRASRSILPGVQTHTRRCRRNPDVRSAIGHGVVCLR